MDGEPLDFGKALPRAAAQERDEEWDMDEHLDDTLDSGQTSVEAEAAKEGAIKPVMGARPKLAMARRGCRKAWVLCLLLLLGVAWWAELAKPVAAKPKLESTQRLSISKSSDQEQLQTLLQKGYAEYQRGNYGAARTAYLRAQEQGANNRDAILGLAATAMRQGERDNAHYLVAQQYYQRLLQLDPQDGLAHAGLLAVNQQYAEGMSLAALKEAIVMQPEAAPLHDSLASRYARQRNWPKAQAAYFNAVSLAPENPDYNFNLAVSLDHLGKGKAALSYYEKAQSLAPSHSHGIDLLALARRLEQLQESP